MAKEFKITSLRLADLEKELNYLKTTREREVAAMIAEARSYGDLSENSEYDAAKNEQAKLYNEFVKMVARQITNVTMTCADKYSQDSYGYTSLSYPIPLFADFERLVKLDPASLEYGLIKTQLVKNKNRINDALYIISQFAEVVRKLLT